MVRRDNMKAKEIERLVKAVVKNMKKAEKKAKQTPREALISFMAKKGYELKTAQKTTYGVKSGAQKTGEALTFSNGKTYIVGEHRFWAQR